MSAQPPPHVVHDATADVNVTTGAVVAAVGDVRSKDGDPDRLL